MLDLAVRLVEGLWVALALVGAASSAICLREALADERHIRARKQDGARRIVARAAVRRAWSRVTALSIFASLGMLLLALGLVDGAAEPSALIRLGPRIAFCIAIAEMTAASVMDRRDRQTLLGLLEVQARHPRQRSM